MNHAGGREGGVGGEVGRGGELGGGGEEGRGDGGGRRGAGYIRRRIREDAEENHGAFAWGEFHFVTT